MQINSAESCTLRGWEVKTTVKQMTVTSTSVFLEYWQHLNFLGTLHRYCWSCGSLSQKHKYIQLKFESMEKPRTLRLESSGKKNCRSVRAFSAHRFISLFYGNKNCQFCHYKKSSWNLRVSHLAKYSKPLLRDKRHFAPASLGACVTAAPIQSSHPV